MVKGGMKETHMSQGDAGRTHADENCLFKK